MTPPHFLPAALLIIASVTALHGQGPLTPPGAPAPTMKTLAQIEPRRPVDATNTPGDAQNAFIISQPGSYYLTADIIAPAGKTGLRVSVDSASGVNIDLNGFSVIGAGQESGDGASGVACSSSLTPVALYNGRVRDWSGTGVYLGGPGRVHDLLVADCGGVGIEINGGNYSSVDESRVIAVERCEIRNVRRYGIVASGARVRDCVVARVRSNAGEGAGGILAGEVFSCRVSNIVGSSSLNFGILADLVADSEVLDVVSPATTIHISGKIVRDCRVARTIDAVSATSSDRGIDAKVVERCHVERLQANTTGVVQGIRAAQVRNSLVERVSNAGSGAALGITSAFVAFAGTGESVTSALHAEGNTVSGIGGIGISGGNGSVRIVGNLVRGCAGDAISEILGGVVAENSIILPSAGSGDGIDVGDGHVSENYVRNSGTGVGVRMTFGGFAVRNTVQGGTAFSFASGVRAGPIVTGGGSTAFDANANVDL